MFYLKITNSSIVHKQLNTKLREGNGGVGPSKEEVKHGIWLYNEHTYLYYNTCKPFSFLDLFALRNPTKQPLKHFPIWFSSDLKFLLRIMVYL